MKRVLPILFVLILIGAIAEGLYIWHPEWFSFLAGTPKTTVEEIPEPEALGPERVTENGTYYEIQAEYPRETPLAGSAGASADAKARTVLETFVTNEIARFKDNADANNVDGRKDELRIEYEEHAASETISYVFTIYQDTGGAHGNTFFRTFTFDTGTGEGLVLANLFTPGATYLDTLSALTRAKLVATLGEFIDGEMLDAGTTPYEDNFQNFYLEGNALVILFPPYQVAPYAAGPQEVRIPLSELSAAY